MRGKATELFNILPFETSCNENLRYQEA